MSTWKLGRHFSELGHEVGVFSFARQGHVELDFGGLWHGVADGGQSSVVNLQALKEALDSFAPDIVINQMPYEREIGALLKKRKRFLLLGCLRNTLFSVKGNLTAYVRRTAPGFLGRFAENQRLQSLFLLLHRIRHRRDLRWILDTYDRFVMFGPPNLNELEYFIPDYDRDRIRLIPNSIPYVQATVPEKEKRILWLGRVSHEQKQAGLALDVWSRLCGLLPDWDLDIVGEGPALAELKHRVEKDKLERIEFHGRQMPDEFYRRSALFFMTSAFEGFPNTLVEAMSYGCVPVIFDSYPVASWIIKDQENGLLVPPFDVEEMTNGLRELAESADRQIWAERALAGVRQFRIDQVGQKWQELFDQELSFVSVK